MDAPRVPPLAASPSIHVAQLRNERLLVVDPNVIGSFPHLFDRLKGIVDVFDQARILAAVLALDQARDIQPRRVQRLQDVVAGSREKARLRDAGVLGRALGERQLRVQPGEFLGAVAHALFQRRIGAFQRFGGLEARGDVGEGDDEAAARHPVGTDLNHHVTVGQALQIGLAFGGVGLQPPRQ